MNILNHLLNFFKINKERVITTEPPLKDKSISKENITVDTSHYFANVKLPDGFTFFWEDEPNKNLFRLLVVNKEEGFTKVIGSFALPRKNEENVVFYPVCTNLNYLLKFKEGTSVLEIKSFIEKFGISIQ